MKSIFEVITRKEQDLRQRELEIQELRQQLEALHLAARVLTEAEQAEAGNAARNGSPLESAAGAKQFP